MDRFLIIADDFTGANDTGVQLRKRGIKTDVIFDSSSINNDEISYVIDTESRGLSSKEAYLNVASKIQDALQHDFKYVFKKVDSTLRGNIVSEIKSVDKYYKAELIIFAPGYPDNKRTTIECIHKLNGIPIKQTEIAKDPKKPVKEDNINILLKDGLKKEVTHVYIPDIREGKIDLSKGKIYTFDVETNEDLISIVHKVIDSKKKVLWVGSAGLADSLLKVTNISKPAIAVIGSISEVSRNQVNYLISKGFNSIAVDIDNLLKNNDISYTVSMILEKLRQGSDLIVTSCLERNSYEKAVKTGRDMGYTCEDVSIFTQNILGDIIQKVVENCEISGLFLTGGDTAIGVIEKLKATGSSIKQELMTGIPLMTLRGGKYDGLKVVTKAGAFGTTNAIEYCVNKLKEDI